MKFEDILLIGVVGFGLWLVLSSAQLNYALSQPWTFGNPGVWVKQPDGSYVKVG